MYEVLYYSDFLKSFTKRIIDKKELNYLKNNNYYILEIKKI